MTVSELIKFLKKIPPDLLVVFGCCSEQCILHSDAIEIKELCEPRPDGWVHDKRPDKPSRKYLVFPSN